MQNIKQYVIDYVEGRVFSKEFRQKVITDPSIVKWLQSIVPEKQEMVIVEGIDAHGKSIIKHVPYNVEYLILNDCKCKN